MGLIYKIANDINDKVYIGQTIRTLKERIKDHLYESKYKRRNYPFYNAIRKYGWKHFKVEVLEDNIPLENLNERELYYTNKYKALSPNGYVLIAGGEPRIVSKEICKKISKSKKGNIPWNKNKKYSEKLKEKIFNGKNNPFAKSVMCYDLNGNFIKEYGCIMDASKELNIRREYISNVCRNKYKSVNGYIWKYK